MKRTLGLILAFFLSAGLATACGSYGNADVAIYDWEAIVRRVELGADSFEQPEVEVLSFSSHIIDFDEASFLEALGVEEAQLKNKEWRKQNLELHVEIDPGTEKPNRLRFVVKGGNQGFIPVTAEMLDLSPMD